MSSSSGLLVHREGLRASFSFSAPERRNALTAALRKEMEAGMSEALAAGARLITLAGVPHDPPVFAAGADLREIAQLDGESAPCFAEAGQGLWSLLEDAPALTIALVDGPCMGGALDLALACDVVACSDRSTFAHPGARLGLVTGWGGTRRLPRAVGQGTALELLTSGRSLDAGKARNLGWVRHVFPADGFELETNALLAEWSRSLIRWSPDEIRLLKRLVRGAGTRAEPALESATCRVLQSWTRDPPVCYPAAPGS